MAMVFFTTRSFPDLARPAGTTAKAEARPRSAKMDKFLHQVNGSTRYDVANVAAQVRQALAQSKKTA